MAYPINCDTVEYQEFQSYAIAPQTVIPPCAPPPVPCTLALTGTAVATAVNVRGGSDGTITITWSGSTGATTCYINGVVDGSTGGDTYEYTGLTAGYYSVFIEEGSCFDQELNIVVGEGSFRTGDFIVTQPATLTAVNNPIAFTIRTANNSGNPRPSKGYIFIDDTVGDGDWVRFQFDYPQVIDVTFIAKGFPNRDEYFLATTTYNAEGVPVTSNTYAEIAQSLGESIEKNTELSRLFSVYVEGQYVYLTAYENNEKLDINTESVTTNDTGIFAVTMTQEGQAAYDGQLVENYSLYADVYVQPNATYGETPVISSMLKIAQLELPYQENNTHRFNLAPVLSPQVQTPKLDWTLSGFTTVQPMLASYIVQYGEKYPLVSNTNTKKSRYKGQSTVRYVLNSSLEWEEVNDLSEYLGSNISNLNPNFSMTAVYHTPSAGDVTITLTNPLKDTGITTTTNIGYRVRTTSMTVHDYGWQTGATFAMTDAPSYPYVYQGYMYISGMTSGITVQYQRQFIAIDSYSYRQIYGGQTAVNINSGVKFLTDKPQILDTQRDASDWLYILLPKDYGRTLKVKADLYFYNGDEVLNQTLYNVFTGSSNAGGVFMFGSGYEQLGLAAYEITGGTTRKIRRVDFALYQNDATNGDYLYSELRSYRYEIDQQLSTFEVAFLNQLGTYDTFTFIGELVDNVQRESGDYEVPLDINQDGSVIRGFQKNTVYNTKITKTIKCNSGWIDENHRDWLVNNLLSSNRIYQITQDDENYLVIESVEESSKSSNNTLFQLNLTFRLTTYENNVNV